jgi:Transposase DDE domain group 1
MARPCSPASCATAVIKLIVTRLCQTWPALRIIVRGDSGFCRQRLIRWCERHAVCYVIGAAVVRNTRRIRILLASHHPLRNLYFIATNALASP